MAVSGPLPDALCAAGLVLNVLIQDIPPLTATYQHQDTSGYSAAPFDTDFPQRLVLCEFDSVIRVDFRNSMFRPITIIGTIGRVGTITNSADSAY